MRSPLSSLTLLGFGALVVASAAAVAACSSSSDDNPQTNTGTQATTPAIPGRDCPKSSPLTYESFGGPFFLSYCTGCHSSRVAADKRQGAPLGMDFDTLEGIRGKLERIYARAGDDHLTMPPAGGPTAEHRKQLGDWLACGAPGNGVTFNAKPLPPKPPIPAACDVAPTELPKAVLPRCSASTYWCIAQCDILDFGCEGRCVAADTTPPYAGFGSPFGCSQCLNYVSYVCMDANGCHSVAAQLECCRQDNCETSTDPNCLADKCRKEAYAYSYCQSGVTPMCTSYDEGPMRGCFPADLGTPPPPKDGGADAAPE
jgi:hypothetical protein